MALASVFRIPAGLQHAGLPETEEGSLMAPYWQVPTITRIARAIANFFKRLAPKRKKD